jgi:hypothetical protein
VADAPASALSHTPHAAETHAHPVVRAHDPLTNERRSVMRNQRDLVKASVERTYPRDVNPLRGVIDTRAPRRRAKSRDEHERTPYASRTRGPPARHAAR